MNFTKTILSFAIVVFTSAGLLEAQSCNYTVNTISATCYGSADGKAELYRDGELVVIGEIFGGTCLGEVPSATRVQSDSL